MVEIRNHFLDTNIILAMILPNDSSFNDSKNYFNCNHNKHFSNTAYKEAKSVIVRNRKISLNILNYIQEYLSANLINENNADNHITTIKNQFIMKFNQKDCPFGFKKEKFKSIVENFIQNNYEKIKEILVNDDLKSLNTSFKKEIINSFKMLNQDLITFIRNLNCITFINPSNVELLKNIGFHESDAILIEESYCLSIFIKSPIAFITFDNGILKYANEIPKTFKSNVSILSPTSFINS